MRNVMYENQGQEEEILSRTATRVGAGSDDGWRGSCGMEGHWHPAWL
jgi:hypothetical protein